MKDWIKKYGVHFVAIATFLAVASAYFSPALDGLQLDQHDIAKHKGMSQEILDHRLRYDEDPLWTNSMFGGMPADQISVDHSSNILLSVSKVIRLGMNGPVGMVFMFMLGFYVLMLVLRVNPWLGIAGAVAYGLSSYFIIVIGAGHNSKAWAIGYMAPIVAGFILTYRRNLILGGALSALAMGLGLAMNHPQIIYYLGFVLFFLGLVELLRSVLGNERLIAIVIGALVMIPAGMLLITIKDDQTMTFIIGLLVALTPLAMLIYFLVSKKDLKPDFDGAKFKKFLAATGVTLVAYGLAFIANYGQLTSSLNYSQYTIRGGDILSTETDTTANKEEMNEKGLDYAYITQWSYGKSETATLLIPNAKGGKSSRIFEDEEFAEKLTESIQENESIDPRFKQQIASGVLNSSAYFGEQPIVSGPVYIGALVMFLAILGLVYLKDPMKWGFFAAALITVMLSWGSNIPGLTHWMIDSFPGYSMFRAVTIILVIAELCLPVLAFVGLDRLLKNRDMIAQDMKKFYVTCGVVLGVVLLIVAMPESLGFNFLTTAEQTQFAQAQEQAMAAGDEQGQLNVAYISSLSDQIKQARMSKFRSDGWRTFGFMLAGALLLWGFARSQNFKPIYVIAGVGILCLGDLYSVDKRYLNNEPDITGKEKWVEQLEKQYPVKTSTADNQILQQEMAANPELAERIKQVRDSVKTAMQESDPDNMAFISRVSDWAAFRELGIQTDFRVWERGSWSSTRSAYFHKSLGGYHGAKLRRIQDIFEHHLDFRRIPGTFTPENQAVLDMFNIRYVISPGEDKNKDGQPDDYMMMPNPGALGSAWCVSDVMWVDTPDEEIDALDSLKPRYTAVMNKEFEAEVPSVGGGTGKVEMTDYRANRLTYKFSSDNDELVVFSHVYYPEGWTATIDGQDAPILRANYVLRALHVPAGEHEIVMSYKNPTLDKGQTYSAIGSWSIVLLVLAAMGFTIWRNRKEGSTQAKED